MRFEKALCKFANEAVNPIFFQSLRCNLEIEKNVFTFSEHGFMRLHTCIHIVDPRHPVSHGNNARRAPVTGDAKWSTMAPLRDKMKSKQADDSDGTCVEFETRATISPAEICYDLLPKKHILALSGQ